MAKGDAEGVRKDMLRVRIAEPWSRLSEYLARGDNEGARLRNLQRRGLVRLGPGALPHDVWGLERPVDAEEAVRAEPEAERAESW